MSTESLDDSKRELRAAQKELDETLSAMDEDTRTQLGFLAQLAGIGAAAMRQGGMK